MKIDVLICADYITDDAVKDKIVVVIDMFRATSVIITAINNGCKKVIPYLTVEETLEESKKYNKDEVILGGERRTVKIDKFDLSNSPLEYTKEIVKDKVVLMTTTNGTRALTKCLKGKKIIIAAMINAKAVAEKLLELNEDIIIVNAGTNGEFSMDDYICSGYIINTMLKEKNNVEITDIAKTANMIYESNKGIIEYVKEARHFSVMKSLNLDNDIEYCIKKSIIDVVPIYDGNKIIKL